MKILQKGALCALLSLLYMGATAQNGTHEKKIPINEPDYRKVKLFADLPETISLNIDILQNLLEADLGKAVSIPVSAGFSYQGIIVSKSNSFDAQTKSIVIKSTNRKGATFTFSKTQSADGTILYRGRVLSFNNIDAYEIAQQNGEYILQKKNLYDLYSE